MKSTTKGATRPKTDRPQLRIVEEPTLRSLAAQIDDLQSLCIGLAKEVASLRNEYRLRKEPTANPNTSAPTADLLYGVPVIATHLRMTDRKVYQLVRNGTLPTFKIGGKVCARVFDLTAWLERQATAGRASR